MGRHHRSGTSLRQLAPSATSRDHKGFAGVAVVMITVRHREGPDPYGVDPLAADEPQVGFNNKPATGDRMPRRPSSDRSREGAVGSEEMIMLDSNQPSAPRRDAWNKGRLIGQKRPLKPKDVVDPDPAPSRAPSPQPRVVQPRDRQQTPGLRSRAAANRRCQRRRPGP